MIFYKRYLYLLMTIVMAFTITTLFYINVKYTYFESTVTSVEVTLNNEIERNAVPLVYVAGEHDSNIDFKKPNFLTKVSDSTYLTSFSNKLKPRRVRLYFDAPNQSVELYSVKIFNAKEAKFIDFDVIKKKEGLSIKKKDEGYKIEVKGRNSYIELPQEIVYKTDLSKLSILIFLLIIVSIITFFAVKFIDIENQNLDTISKVTLALLVISIFCPAPIYNIALIATIILNLSKLPYFDFRANKISFIIAVFFLVYLINNLLVSSDGYKDMSAIERFLPLLLLSFIIPVINDRKMLVFFPATALFLGFGFLVTSLIDVLVYENEIFLSFEFFAKYLHPIYYSYLLFFSICYVYLHFKGIRKYVLIGIFFVLMVFSGSKMVLVFTIIAMFINIVRINNTGFWAIPILLILIIFSPLKNRFNEILKTDDMSILKERHIDNPYDARINGLTLRLILWREALSTMNGMEYIVGNGITDSDEDELSAKLYNLGLTKHVNYNPHNQYVDTFWRTGMLGLIFLLLIPATGLFIGIKNKDPLLIQFSVFMVAVMFSESIFGRVNGIYFFTVVLLMLSNSKPINENSNIRN